MPLTVRSNGSTSANIITSAWFNDYYNLLTGAMQDQEVTIKNVLILQAIGGAPAAAPTAAVVAGTGMGIGAYVYTVTFANPDGETTVGPTVSATTTSGNQKVNLSAIPLGPTGTTKRNLYRTVVGGGTSYKFLTALGDNTTTTYSDVTADASLGAAPPTSPTFGGALIIKDQSGVVKFKINNDGSFSSGGTTGFGNTTVTGTLTVTGITTLDNGLISTSGSGQMIFPNNQGVYIKNSTGVAKTALVMDTGNALRIVAPTTGVHYNITFFNAAGTRLGWVDDFGAGFTMGQIQTYRGTGVYGFSFFSGAGSVTVAHGFGATPVIVIPVQNVAGSETMGYNTLGSVNVTVQTGAGAAWSGLAMS